MIFIVKFHCSVYLSVLHCTIIFTYGYYKIIFHYIREKEENKLNQRKKTCLWDELYQSKSSIIALENINNIKLWAPNQANGI